MKQPVRTCASHDCTELPTEVSRFTIKAPSLQAYSIFIEVCNVHMNELLEQVECGAVILEAQVDDYIVHPPK